MHKKPLHTRGSVTVLAALSIALLLVAVGYKVAHRDVDAEIVKNIIASPSFSAPLFETDSDGDGLPDWQEALLGTDPNDPDSDGDGSPDTFAARKSETKSNSSPSPSSSPADILGERLMSEYLSLKESGAYTDARGQLIGEKLASNLRANAEFIPYAAGDFTTTNDLSYERMLAYRAAMRDALAPMLSLGEAEFVIYARYVESKDAAAIQELLEVSDVYATAAKATSKIVVPKDVLDTHAEVVNALSFYAAVLSEMVTYAYDPVASFALLRTYSEAEKHLFTSFDTLSAYYVFKYREKNQ